MPHRWTRPAIAAALATCWVLTACGTDGTDRAEPAAETLELDLGDLPADSAPDDAPIPLTSAPVNPLPAGTYRTTVGPEVTFTVDDRWSLEAMDDLQGSLLFGSYSPMDVVAPRVEWIDMTAAGARVVPADLRGVPGSVDPARFERWAPLPDDLGDWFASQPGIDVGPLEQVEVGGRPATTFTFSVPGLPAGSDAFVVWPCIRLLGGADWGWPTLEGDEGRMWIVDVDGNQLLLQVRTQPGDADLVIPAGLEVVSSMTIGPAP